MKKPEIILRVPGQEAYGLVLRTALGGVAILKDLDAGTLDDLRNASDEACDCLLHQGCRAEWLELAVLDGGTSLDIRLSANFAESCDAPNEDENDVSRAVLETLVSRVEMEHTACGCVSAITLTLTKAVAMGA
ncbi:MAG: hypothetical protein IJ438_03800 [Clostridia bacterium]|nr:hypothetical protein [Clostridia bacterium]